MAESGSILDHISDTGNEEMRKIHEEIRRNLKEHTVVSGDTISGIAKNLGIDRYEDILALNNLMDKKFETRGINGTTVLIKKGDSVWVPRDLDKFRSDIETIRRIDAARVISEGIAKGDRKILSKEINERIFPHRPQSVGMANMLDGFVKAQENEPDPRHARMVIPSRSFPGIEEHASCSYHTIKSPLAQCFNISDLTKGERKLLQTKNVDAWIMPGKLIGIGFNQVQNLMRSFDPMKLTSREPIPNEKRETYRQDMLGIGNYLETRGIPGSVMPIYFKSSDYLGNTAAYNEENADKHYNTHMSMFARNAHMKFQAYEFGEVRNGIVVPFGNDKERINKEIVRLKGDLEVEKAVYVRYESRLREATKIEKNPDLQQKIHRIDKKIDSYVKGIRDVSKREIIRHELQELFATEDPAKIKNKLPGIINYPVTDADANFIIALQSNKRRILEGLEKLRKALDKKNKLEFITFDATEYTSILAGSNVFEAFTRYNDTVKSIHKIEEQIGAQEQILKDLHKLQVSRAAEYEQAEKELAHLRPEFKKMQEENILAKQELLKMLDPEKNKGLQERLGNVERKALQRVGNDSGKVGAFMRALQVNDTATLMGRFRQSQADCTYLRNLLHNKNKLEASIATIKLHLGIETKGGQLAIIDPEDIGRLLGRDHAIMKVLGDYNKSVENVNRADQNIALNEEKLKIKKEISVIDYMASFLQQRGDYSQRVMTEAGKKQMIAGMKDYASLIHLKVNGANVDLAAEFKLPISKRMKITPEDTIEITGPMMIDGLHMFNSDGDRAGKMNTRTRFFFEFAVSGVFLPTELLEPGETSSFRKEKFGKITDGLVVKNNYDVRRRTDEHGNVIRDKKGWALSENISQVLKKRIPIFEKEAFAKLDIHAPDYHKKYNALIQHYYGLQIKALQMMGFMESEDRLNPGATDINRYIPYYDTTNINSVFSTYISNIKAQTRKSVESTAAYREFAHIRVLPGDTTARLHSRLVHDVEAAKSQYEKYPNLAALSGFNDYLVGLLWREIIKKGTQGESKKQNNHVTVEDFTSGKLKLGTSVIISFGDLDEIIGRLRKISYTPDISPKLRQVDRDVINAIAVTEQDRNLLRSTLFIETYEYADNRWLPNGISNTTKRTLQKHPLLQKIHSLSSFGDFQVREIKGLRYGFGEEFIRRDKLQKALDSVGTLTILQKYLTTNSPVVQEDLKKVAEMRALLKKPDLSKENMITISEDLIHILRIDQGNGATIVGKIVGGSLLLDKYHIHTRKFDYFLSSIGEPVESFRDDPDKNRRYEDVLFFTNNKGEKVRNLGFMENYIYRILEKTKVLEKGGIHFKYNKVEFDYIGGKIGEFIAPDTTQRSIKYNANIFIDNISNITEQLSAGQRNFTGTPEEKQILSKLIVFGENIQKIGLKYQKIFDTLNEEIRTRIGKEKGEMIALRNKEYEYRDREIFNEISSFMRDPEMGTILSNASVDTSFLPTQEEWFKNDPFRYPFFGYVRKANNFQSGRNTVRRDLSFLNLELNPLDRT